MKKLLFFIIISIFLCTLPSCSGDGGNVVMEINSTTQINDEIFSYFLNESYYAQTAASDTEHIERATSECLKYAAVNTRFSMLGKTLSPQEKADVSKETNALWRIYGDYYSQIGVSKDTFFKIKQYEYFKENLRLSLYDTNGSNPIKEDYIKQYFTANYVGIKYFYEELYTVIPDEKLQTMSEYERTAYESAKNAAQRRYEYISSVATYVNSSVYNMDEAFMAVTGQVSADISVSADVVSRTGSSFSEEFVEAVFKQAVGSAFIITNPERSYIYFIERVDLLDSKYDFYSKYRNDCLKAVSESFFVSEINTWINSCKAVRHLSEAKQCLETIKNTDRSRYIGTADYKFSSFIPKEDI